MSGMNIKLAVFDFEGTVVDTAGAATASFSEMLRFYDINGILPSQIKSLVTFPNMETVRELLYDPTFPSDFYHRAMFKYESLYRSKMAEKTKLYRGFKKILKDLAQNEISVCLVSNQNYELVSENIDALEVTDFFDFIIAADQVQSPKPGVDMLEQLMLVTGADTSQTVMIGDEPIDIEMGKKAGVKTIAVQWGYSSAKVLEESGADIFVAKPVDLELLLA